MHQNTCTQKLTESSMDQTSLSSLPLLSSPIESLEVRPLNPARGAGEHCKLTSRTGWSLATRCIFVFNDIKCLKHSVQTAAWHSVSKTGTERCVSAILLQNRRQNCPSVLYRFWDHTCCNVTTKRYSNKTTNEQQTVAHKDTLSPIPQVICFSVRSIKAKITFAFAMSVHIKAANSHRRKSIIVTRSAQRTFT